MSQPFSIVPNKSYEQYFDKLEELASNGQEESRNAAINKAVQEYVENHY